VIIAESLKEDPAVRLFIGQQNTLDLVFEAFLEPDLIKAGRAAGRLTAMHATELPA
jgi:hypothetical protein